MGEAGIIETLMHKQEDLHPDLAPYVEPDGDPMPMLRHPLVYYFPYAPAFNAMINRQYQWKQEKLTEYARQGNWDGYIMTHERPWRLHAFQEVLGMGDIEDKKYWKTLAWIWRDSENIRQNRHVWRDLLMAPRVNRDDIMEFGERAMLAKMPDMIQIYRGSGHEDFSALSWTTDKAVAEWFSRRHSSGAAFLLKAKVRKSSVIAYFTGRNEHEIVVEPQSLISPSSAKTIR